MNNETRIKRREERVERGTKVMDWPYRTVAVGLALVVSVSVLIYSALADVPQPVLTIAPLGTNQFSITITNAVTTTNYTLFWTPVLADEYYPWQMLDIGSVGQTNFTVDGGTWQILFFEVLLGADQDGDGAQEWEDAQPTNPNVGILSVTIDSPTNGFTFN